MIKKQKTNADLKKDLDAIFSKFIRLTYSNENGFVCCYTCDNILSWKNITNGHFVDRGKLAVRFDERNCRPQCWGCNSKAMGNGMLHIFGPKLESEYGPGIIVELMRLGQTITKYYPYQEKIDYYKPLVKELLEQKHL